MKRKDVVLILMFLLVGTSMVDAQEIVNLFDNPGFEEGTGTEVQEIPGWRLYGQENASGLLTIDTEEAIEGKQCAFIEVTGVPAGGTWNLRFDHTERFSVKKGETYTMSFWLKGDVGPITLSASRAEQNAAGQWGNLAQEVVNLTPEWEEYHLTFESPEDRTVMWQLLISNPGQTYYVDHARCYVGEYVPDQIGPRLQAYDPYPFNEATDVPCDVVLNWTPGEFAPAINGHRVYFGESFSDVNDGVGGITQSATSYNNAGSLAFETTYYWRVDEVNAPPDSTVFKGEVWSFTTELFAYPITNITATASSENTLDMGAGNTVDGSGLAGDLHSIEPTDMWLSSIIGAQPTWIQYEFDKSYNLFDMWVWNSNQSIESVIGFGVKDVTVEVSEDGANWTSLGDVEIPKALGQRDSARDATVDLGGATAKFVKLTVNSGWGGIVPQYGLSEVRFFYIPLEANDPTPADADSHVDLDVTLSWRSGREVAAHEVYFSTDKAAVEDGTALVATVTEGNFTPGTLEYGQVYYWKVNEVNDAAAVPVREGDVWEFSTIEDLVVEDFESYTDNDLANEAIWQSWIDGFGVSSNGSQVGYVMPPYAELAIVHSGSQSMPLSYDNSAGATNSQATLTLTSQKDWTIRGLGELSVWFRGYPASAGGFVEAPAGTFTVTGEGADIWGTADEFHYVYKQLTGVGSIIARVDSVDNTDPWAKSGVMIRDSLDAGSAFAAVYITPTNSDGTPTQGCRFQARTDTGGSATSDTALATDEQQAITAPYWVKIERDAGGNFRGSYSSNGTAWTPMAWRPGVSMGSTVYVGLALTSHVVGVQGQAVFSGVATEGNVTGQWQSQDIGILNNSAEPLYVELASGGASGTVLHDDPAATQIDTWTRWRIDLQQFADQGVNLTNIDTISIGVGDTNPGGTGIMYFDDISLSRLSEQAQP